MMTRVLLVDGNRPHAEKTARVIGQIKPDWRCLVVDSCQESRNLFNAFGPDAAVLKADLRDGDAFELMHDFKAVKPELPVIMMVPDSPESRLLKAKASGAFALLPARVPVGLLVLDLEMAIESAKARLQEMNGAKLASAASWKKPYALATFPANRAIALYRPFDIFSLVHSWKSA